MYNCTQILKRLAFLFISAVAMCFIGCNPEPEVIPVSKLSIDPSSLNLFPGDTQTLSAVIEPSDATDKEVVWSSGDETIAIIGQNGEVTAVSPGIVYIYATSVSDWTVRWECKLTVKEKTYPVTGISISETKLELAPKETAALNVTVQPNYATTTLNTMIEAWPETFCGLSGAPNMHGAAIALRNASNSSVWSQDHDNVAASSNWECSVDIASDRSWLYSKSLSVAAFNYNEKRGSSHDIKAYEAIHEYGKSQFTTIGAFHWVLPTANMDYLNGDYNIHLFDYPYYKALNENISAAGGVTVTSDDYYWSVNVQDKSTALSVPYSKIDKNTKLPVRARFIF